MQRSNQWSTYLTRWVIRAPSTSYNLLSFISNQDISYFHTWYTAAIPTQDTEHRNADVNMNRIQLCTDLRLSTENAFKKCSCANVGTSFIQSCLTKWGTSTHPCLWLTEPLGDAFSYIMILSSVINEPIYLCNVPNRCFFFFFGPLLVLFQLVWETLLPLTQNKMMI